MVHVREQVMRGRSGKGCGLVAGFKTEASRQAYNRMIDQAGVVEDSGIRLGARLKRNRASTATSSTSIKKPKR